MREYIQNKEYINLCERKYIMKNLKKNFIKIQIIQCPVKEKCGILDT